MGDALDHLKTHSKLYFEVLFPIRKQSFQAFPIEGFVHISGTGDKIQYVSRIDEIEPFSKDHYEKPELYGDVRPGKWIKEWQENKGGIQGMPWKYALVISKIEPVSLTLASFLNRDGKPVKKIRGYSRVIPPKAWGGFGSLSAVNEGQINSQAQRLVEDVDDIIKRKDLDTTTKEALINARKGQGKFRVEVLRRWGSCCSVTGSTTLGAVRASHIKPWRESSDVERLDPNNGLPLVASLDALFDRGLISFNSSGGLIVSPKLDPMERKIFGISDKSLMKKPTGETAKYLAYHRRRHGFKEKAN